MSIIAQGLLGIPSVVEETPPEEAVQLRLEKEVTDLGILRLNGIGAVVVFTKGCTVLRPVLFTFGAGTFSGGPLQGRRVQQVMSDLSQMFLTGRDATSEYGFIAQKDETTYIVAVCCSHPEKNNFLARAAINELV